MSTRASPLAIINIASPTSPVLHTRKTYSMVNMATEKRLKTSNTIA
jgi:hypothetical protein